MIRYISQKLSLKRKIIFHDLLPTVFSFSASSFASSSFSISISFYIMLCFRLLYIIVLMSNVYDACVFVCVCVCVCV